MPRTRRVVQYDRGSRRSIKEIVWSRKERVSAVFIALLILPPALGAAWLVMHLED